MNIDNHDATFGTILKIIGDSAGKIQFLCKDNPPSFLTGKREVFENELKENFKILKSQLKEVDVNQPTGKRLTLLAYAAHCGWLEVVKYLVEEKGANVNQAGSNGKTPLHEAAWRNIDVVLYLIEKGAEVNLVDKNGRTPLHVAASFLGQFAKRRASKNIVEYGPFRQIELVQSLLAAGAKVQEDNEGRTPLDLTDRADAPEGLKLFIIPTLLSNPKINKPNNIEKNEKLSAYWDVQAARINFCLEGDKKTDINQDAKKNLKKITSEGNTTLGSLAFFSLPTVSHKVSEAEKTVASTVRSG